VGGIAVTQWNTREAAGWRSTALRFAARWLRPQLRQNPGVGLVPSTANPAPRGCSAVAAAQRVRAAAVPGRRPAAAFISSNTADSRLLSTIVPGCTVWILSNTLKPSTAPLN
jgi:hypothetical protein